MFLDIIAEFLKKCPALSGKKITVGYLSPKIGAVSLETVSAPPIIKRYTDGAALCQTVFSLNLRGETDEEMNFSPFFEEFLPWVESVSSPHTLPPLSGGFSPISLSVLRCGAEKSGSSTVFRIVCRFEYSN